jgi:hypothetical protein
MENAASLSFLQQLAIGPSPESDKYDLAILMYNPFQYYPHIYASYSLKGIYLMFSYLKLSRFCHLSHAFYDI